VSEARITYTPRRDATPEAELNALAAAYHFILFESQSAKKAAHPGGPEDPERRSDEIRAKTSIPRG
jgi:hypothetical protein